MNFLIMVPGIFLTKFSDCDHCVKIVLPEKQNSSPSLRSRGHQLQLPSCAYGFFRRFSFIIVFFYVLCVSLSWLFCIFAEFYAV